MTDAVSYPTVKVIFVGSSSVGKTCLIAELLHQETVSKPMSTVAPTFNVVDVKQKSGLTVALQVWDTAGQERYYSVNQLFYRDADIACVCYDPGNELSKNSVPDWVKSVIDEVPSAKIFLVLTKMDLYNEQQIESFKTEADNLKDTLSAEHIFYTSSVSKTGYEDLLQIAAESIKIEQTTTSVSVNVQSDGNKKSCC